MTIHPGKLGLGLAAIGRPAYINLGHDLDLEPGRSVADLRRRTHQLLDHAWDAGVRCVDAARSYGLAEQFLGEWLARHAERRADLTVGSKWGYTYVGDWRPEVSPQEIKDHSAGTFERQWRETLAALGGPPDLYLVHSLTSDSSALHDPVLLDRLGRLAGEGVRVGLSTSGPRQAETLRAALALGGPFSAVQSTWNPLEPSVGPALAEAHAAGWFVTVKEAVANGRLTARAGDTAFNRLAAAQGVSPDALALGAAIANPWVDVVLSGASTVGQLTSNLAFVDTSGVDPDRWAELVETPDAYWSERAGLPWI